MKKNRFAIREIGHAVEVGGCVAVVEGRLRTGFWTDEPCPTCGVPRDVQQEHFRPKWKVYTKAEAAKLGIVANARPPEQQTEP